MSLIPLRGQPNQAMPGKWLVVHSALGSWAKTIRLIMIMLATAIPPDFCVWLMTRR